MLALRVLAIVATVGCGGAISVYSPSVTGPWKVRARWALTPPSISGSVNVATAGDAVYVLGCAESLTVYRVDARGSISWSRKISPTCYGPEANAIAADGNGVLVGFQATRPDAVGVRAIRVSPTGSPRWSRWIDAADVQSVRAASRPGKHVLCIRSRLGKLQFVTFDDHNRPIGEHLIENSFAEDASCGFDEAGDLWVTAKGRVSGMATIDGTPRPISSGTWAFRFEGTPKMISVSRTSGNVTEVAGGWVVYDYPSRIFFIDRSGAAPWTIDLPDDGCTVSPTVIDATAIRLVAAAHIFCGQRGGTSKLGDIEIRDDTRPDDDLAQHDILFDLDTSTMRARSLRELEDAPESVRFTLGSRGIFAYGAFSESLGMGTSVTSRPARYQCVSTLPTDASTWTMYESQTPSCRDGFHLKTRYPTWPFVASFPLLASQR